MTTGLGGKSCGTGVAEAPRSVSLEVLPSKPARQAVKKSKVSKWRAGVLIGVHVLMIAHIIQWLIQGRTIAPVEPSEAMYALELGRLNAGFIFFCAALLATFIFGRFFCGWACHVVALQDLCAHWMNRMGVRPKPLRSRLLLWAPLLLALYMFVWPTFKRVALVPLETQIAKWVEKSDPARAEKWTFPDWLLDLSQARAQAGHPGFHKEFIVEEYWATFPTEWYIIVPFLGVCGFATVYFLGSKGFCTYGCPYGGFFAPMDKVSIGRIVVDHDKCEGCGHCTAACTSNVRVSQEVKDFGMVVDPGCMKCLDCVSVCPNDALSFSFARPAVFKKAHTEEAKQGKTRRPEYDVSWWQDAALLVLCVVFFIGFRQMFNKIPLLMAAGMALCGGFIAWKLWTLATEPNVRLQSLQLKLKGKLKPAGLVVAVLGSLYLAWGAWGATNQGLQFAANYYDIKVKTPFERVFSAGYTPTSEDAANAGQVVKLLKLAGPVGEGGMGWTHSVELNLRLAWNLAVLGERAEAEEYLRRAIAKERPSPQASTRVVQLAQLLGLRGMPQAEVLKEIEAIAAAKPHLYGVRLMLAQEALGKGNRERAIQIAEAVLASEKPELTVGERIQAATVLFYAEVTEKGFAELEKAIDQARDPERRTDVHGLLQAAETYLQLGRGARAADLAEWVLKMERRPFPGIQMHAVSVMLRSGRGEDSLKYLPQILEHRKPRPDAGMVTQIGDLYLQAGKMKEAEETLAAAVKEHPKVAFARATYARALAMNGRNEQALAELEAACALDGAPEYLSAKAELLNAMGRTAEAQKALEAAQRAADRRLQPAGQP
ncbi:MAG TPA: tetratricopeptide repeat protein [Phycisphaerales bacterium]|nr:tetratricopeptide repeat protein [Phycisphaerales bacterium]